MTPGSTILIVEGRKPKAEYLAPTLRDQGYTVIEARTRKEALTHAQGKRPAIIVLDVPSLRFDHRRLCQDLANLDASILALLSADAKIDRSIGARAHLRYPFSAKKLINRIARLLPDPDSEVLQLGELSLNIERRSVLCNGNESHLTPKQARLLEVFMCHPNKVLTRAFLMRRVWETDYVEDTRTLEVHIHWLRKALGKRMDSSICLRTVRRVGYQLDVPDVK